MPPSTNPSASAYSGAVKPAQPFLKMVTIASTRPPMAPTISNPATDDGSPVAKKRFHVHAAVAMHRSISMPALFTAPDTVMLSPPYPAMSRKVFCPRAGFEVLIRSAIQILLTNQTSDGEGFKFDC